MNKIENYLGIANHDIQMANNSQELKSYVASILCENDELQQENQKYKEVINKAIEYIKDLYDVRFTDKDKRKLLEILGDKENEKIYQFNEYVLGYDKGENVRSCLVISKYLLDKLYVVAELYDGSAEIISTILDSLQQENKQLKIQISAREEVCNRLESNRNKLK